MDVGEETTKVGIVMSVLGDFARALIGRAPYNPRLEPEALQATKNYLKAGGSKYGFPQWSFRKKDELSTNQQLRAFLNAEKLREQAQSQQDKVTLSHQATEQTAQEPQSFWDRLFRHPAPFLPSSKSTQGNP